MSTLLVTGGAGFIGSHTCLRLLEIGHKIIVLDNFTNSSPQSLERVKKIIGDKASNILKIIHGDIRDKILLEDIFNSFFLNGQSIEAVIHFAGLKSVEESTRNPLKYWDCNVNGSLCLLEVMAKNNCTTIVFSSSANIYGSQTDKLICENDLIRPENPYGETKAVIEKILNNLFHSSPMVWKISCLRYFNPIGAHPSGLIGEAPTDSPTNIFPSICKVASGKKKEIEIFGNDWETRDGTPIRDYIHIMDLAEGHCVALRYLLDNPAQIFSVNLGTGNGSTVLEIIKTFESINNIKIPYSFVGRRSGDVRASVADNSYSKKILNWSPSLKLADMCKNGWNWQRQNPDGFPDLRKNKSNKV